VHVIPYDGRLHDRALLDVDKVANLGGVVRKLSLEHLVGRPDDHALFQKAELAHGHDHRLGASAGSTAQVTAEDAVRVDDRLY